MKKRLLLLLLLSLFCFSVWSAEAPQYYGSSYMLDNYYVLDGNQGYSKAILDNTKLSIVFIDSGDVLYQWFGHIGVLVETSSSQSILYDYGRFEFGPDFYVNFAMGRLWYRCVASYAFYELTNAVQADRSIYVKPLNLTNEEKAAVLTFLNTNSSSEYSTYLYHNYKDNCSTRIRDLFDRLTEGSFKNEMESRDGYTYREMANMVLSRNLFVLWTLDALQGRNVDLDQTYWDQMFLPSVFFEALDEYPEIAGETSVVYESKSSRSSYAEEPVNYTLAALAVAVGLGLIQLTLTTLRNKKKIVALLGSVYSFTLQFALGIIGSVLFFMMFFTLHDYTYLNENILFLNPVLLVTAFLSIKPEKHRKTLKFIYGLFMALILILISLKLILHSVFIQNNWPQIISLSAFYLFNFASTRL